MDNLLDNKLKEFSNKFDLGAIDFSKYTAGRTSFQLERFVMQEHDLPERKFLQLMMELKSMRDGFIGDCFDIEKLKIEIKRLQLKNDEIDNPEACKKQYILRQHEENMIFREREIKTIVNHEIKNDIALLVDWWEHAWVLDYQHDKGKYLDNIWRIIDWEVVNARLV